ncbi:unnamed protein product [Echinostoma caproni]|uniref:RAB3GAP2_N domain-containing protein n=1 Tax=Echinostoma caproni TaxID=27848 RepID=A0A183ACZ1_9TREM|nr:unnamed protein product [Echinostoma caproni]
MWVPLDTRHRKVEQTFAEPGVGLGEVEVANEGRGEDSEESKVAIRNVDSRPDVESTEIVLVGTLDGCVLFVDVITPSLPSLLFLEAKRRIFGSRGAQSTRHILRMQPSLTPDQQSIPAFSVHGAPITKLNFSRALTDQHRQTCSRNMVISADRHWFAVTDNLGRVLLVDVRRERVVRIWKGYRDAELAFFELTDKTSSSVRDTRCLLIHAPHRRMLELFRLVHGPCLSTWDVDEPVRLIPAYHQVIGDFYPAYGLDRLRGMHQVFLLDKKGTLYTLQLGTALCLAETDSEAALNYHDYQMLQACYTCLEQLHALGPATVSAQLLDHFAQFKSASWFERAIQNTSLPELELTEFTGHCISLLSKYDVRRENGVQFREFQRLRFQLSKMHSVMQFYLKAASVVRNLMHIESVRTDSEHANAWHEEAESIADLLNWDVDEATRCLSVYSICSQILRPSSHLRLTKPIEIRAFRDCFKYTVNIRSMESSSQILDTESTARVFLTLRPDDTTSRSAKIDLIASEKTHPFDWSSNHTGDSATARSSSDHPDVVRVFQRLWDKLRDFVVASSQLSSSYLLSLVFRSLLYQAWESVDRDASIVNAWYACAQSASSASTAEKGQFLGVDQSTEHPTTGIHSVRSSSPVIHTDSSSVPLKPVGSQAVKPIIPLSTLNALVDHWHDTCTRLEDLFTLGLLVQLPATDTHDFSRDPDSANEPQVFPITLRRAFNCGRACLTELFASWLVHWHIPPDQLITFYQSICHTSESNPNSDSTELALIDSSNLRRGKFVLFSKCEVASCVSDYWAVFSSGGTQNLLGRMKFSNLNAQWLPYWPQLHVVD